jgi:transposase
MLDPGTQSREVLGGDGPAAGEIDGARGVSCPFAPICRDWRYEARYRESMHRLSMEREALLKEERAELRRKNRELLLEVEDLKAKVALQNKLLFVASTEKEAASVEDSAPFSGVGSRRRRGQQPGAKGHGRRPAGHLPVVIQDHDLREDEKRCERCGLTFDPFPADEQSEQIEVEVRAYRRVHRRKMYRRACKCPDTPGIVTAPLPPALIPKGRFGVSIWTSILIDKFHFVRPTYRLVRDFASHDLFLSQGTITDGLRRLGHLFEPIYLSLREKCLTEDHWHADETGWLVFEKTSDGKKGRRRYLWIFKSPSAAVYVLDRSRSADVPRAFFAGRADGIISADRYSAYKSLMKDGAVLIAFCWAHVRRDFLRVRDGYPKYAKWAQAWVDRISKVYMLNDRRLASGLDQSAFSIANETLRLYLREMETTLEAELAAAPRQRKEKVLKSLRKHWDGLTLFFGFPEIPLDNNEAERLLRTPVVGRKNYYGSGTEWSGHLAAMMFSIFQTLTIWGIEPRRWLTFYLDECARRRGRPSEDVGPYLPWTLSEEDRDRLSVRRWAVDTT